MTWALQWRSRNRLDGETRFLLTDWRVSTVVKLFETRAQARAFAQVHYGYIKRSPDLRREPHGWRMPVAVKVKVVMA